jgi:hypothetical protein
MTQISVGHMQSQTLTFTDKTASLISGLIIFEPSLVKQSTCPVAGATITILKNGDPISMISDDQGRFEFSANVGEIVEVTVSYGEHEFSPSKNTFQMGTGNKTITFYDTTKELMGLALAAEMESSQNIFRDQDLHWTATADVCTPTLTYNLKGLVKDKSLPAMQYRVAIARAPDMVLSDQFANNKVITTFKADALANCSATSNYQIIDFFTRLNNLYREIDLRNAPQNELYVVSGLKQSNNRLIRSNACFFPTHPVPHRHVRLLIRHVCTDEGRTRSVHRTRQHVQVRRKWRQAHHIHADV